MKLVHTSSLERHGAIQHGVEDDSCAPEVNAKGVSVFVSQDLWCYVCRSSALVAHFDARSGLLAYSKISDFDLSFAVQQNIVQFDVTMSNVL